MNVIYVIMSIMNKVSVIIPIYNSEKTLKKCLDSIINQTVRADEIILIDDCSSDNSKDTCLEYKNKYSNIEVYFNHVNKGVAYSRNLGIEKSKNELILFIDSDDYVGEDYIEKLLLNSDADFVTCGYNYQNSQYIWKEKIFRDELVSVETIRKKPSVYLGKYYFGAPWAKLYKKRIINDFHIRFDVSMKNGEDILFAFNYLEHVQTIRIVKKVSYFYTYQSSSLTHIVFPEYWKWRIVQEKAIANFFCPENDTENFFLKDRQFNFLQTTISYYDNLWDNKNITLFYSDEFFSETIKYKKRFGSIDEKKYLFIMRSDHFIEYRKIKECINKIKSMIKSKL